MNNFLKIIVNTYKVLKDRWKAETPKIYKKIRNIAAILTLVIPIIGGMGDKYTWMKVPKFFNEYSWYFMAGSAVIAGTFQFTKEKNSDEENKNV